MDDKSEITLDTLFDGNLICYQNRKGYRFSIDSVLLSSFSNRWKDATILDLGCGCAILSLLLLYKNNDNIISIVGIELQETLVKLARRNSVENHFNDKLKIVHGDLRNISDFFPAEKFSHIICNPPFYKIGRGRQSTNKEAFLARHQSTASTEDIVHCIAYSLKNKGQVSIVYPSELLTELTSLLINKNIQPKRIRIVYSYPESNIANLVLIESVKNGGVGVEILPPLYIYEEKNGEYTQEVLEMYRP